MNTAIIFTLFGAIFTATMCALCISFVIRFGQQAYRFMTGKTNEEVQI